MIVGLLLAAGAGSRFGGDKLLAPLGGATVGALAARALRGSVDRGVAVVRPGDARLARLFEAEGFEPLPFPLADRGMGASLAFGVTACAGADGCLVSLGDMPFVRPETVASLARLLRGGASIVAPRFEGRRGHPVGFHASLFPELAALYGERGARDVLARHETEVALFECDDIGTLRDVDAPTDLREGRIRVNR